MLYDIMPGASSIALSDYHFSGLEQRMVAADSSSTPLAYALGSADMAAAPQIVAHFVAHKKHRNYKCLKEWSEWQDSNLRPLRPERK
jgi:hypothetical protein